ncbi:hypothetical protein BD408DRAFT_420547, partial [Parasitella parasitica]
MTFQMTYPEANMGFCTILMICAFFFLVFMPICCVASIQGKQTNMKRTLGCHLLPISLIVRARKINYRLFKTL